MSDKIQVAIKVRPLVGNEDGAGEFWQVVGNELHQLNIDGNPTGDRFAYDHVFGKLTTNMEVFEQVVKPLVDRAVKGFNVTVFAYGQTSSGKTYTMLGDRIEAGVMQLAVSSMFDFMKKSEGREFLVRASYMEIYNEKVNDLLDQQNNNLKIKEVDGKVLVYHLKEELVADTAKVMNLLMRGQKIRRIGETNLNERSSRSHTIFRMIIESRLCEDGQDGTIQVSQLNLVDLAGSERAGMAGTSGERLKEGCAINRSLFQLSQVVSQLSEGSQFVNFRNSKLTRILQSSLGGNAHTLIICTVTPASVEFTLSTLGFASRAKAVRNKPEVNEVMSDGTLIKKYAKQLEKLKAELKMAKERNVTSELESKLEEQEKINSELQRRISVLMKTLIVAECVPKSRPNRRRTWGGHVPHLDLSKGRKNALGTISEMDTSLVLTDNDSNTPYEDFEVMLYEDEKCSELQRVSSESNLSDWYGLSGSAAYLLSNTASTSALSPRYENCCDAGIQTTPVSTETPIKAGDTPPSVLRSTLQSLEKEYQELHSFTRHECDIIEKLENELAAKECECQKLKGSLADKERILKDTLSLQESLTHQLIEYDNSLSINNMGTETSKVSNKFEEHTKCEKLENKVVELEAQNKASCEQIAAIRENLCKEVISLNPNYKKQIMNITDPTKIIQMLMTCIMEKQIEIVRQLEKKQEEEACLYEAEKKDLLTSVQRLSQENVDLNEKLDNFQQIKNELELKLLTTEKELEDENVKLNTKIRILEENFKLKISDLEQAKHKLAEELLFKEQYMCEQKCELDSIQKEVIGKDRTIVLLTETVGKLEGELHAILKTDESQISLLEDENIQMKIKLSEEVQVKEKFMSEQKLQLESLQQELSRKEGKITMLTENLTHLEGELKSKKFEISRLNYEQSEQNTKITMIKDDFQLKIKDLVEANGELAREVEIKEQSMSEQKLQLEYIQKEITGKDETITLLMENVGQLEDKLKSIPKKKEDQIYQTDCEMSDLNTNITSSEENFKINIKDMEDSQFKTAEEMQIKEQYMSKQNLELENIQQEISGKDEIIVILTEKLSHLENELKSKEDQILQLNYKHSELYTEMRKLEDNLQTKEQYMREQKLELESIQVLSGKDEKIAVLTENLTHLEEESNMKENLISQLTHEKSELNIKIRMLDDEIQMKTNEFEQTKNKLTKDLEIKEQNINEQKLELDCLQKKVTEKDETITLLMGNVGKLEGKFKTILKIKEDQISLTDNETSNIDTNIELLEETFQLKIKDLEDFKYNLVEAMQMKEQCISEEKLKLENIQQVLSGKDEKIAILTENLTHLEDELKMKENLISQLTHEKSELTTKIRMLDDKIQMKTNELEQTTDKLTKDLEIKEQNIDETITLLTGNVGKLEGELKAILKSKGDQISLPGVETSNINTNIRLLEETSQLKINDLVGAMQMKEQCFACISKQKLDLSGKDEKIAILTEKLTHLEDEVKIKENLISKLNYEKSELNIRIRMLDDDIQMKTNELEQTKDKLAKVLEIKEHNLNEQKLELDCSHKEVTGKDETIIFLIENIVKLECELKEILKVKEVQIPDSDDEMSDVNTKVRFLEENLQHAKDKLSKEIQIREHLMSEQKFKLENIEQELFRKDEKIILLTENVTYLEDELKKIKESQISLIRNKSDINIEMLEENSQIEIKDLEDAKQQLDLQIKEQFISEQKLELERVQQELTRKDESITKLIERLRHLEDELKIKESQISERGNKSNLNMKMSDENVHMVIADLEHAKDNLAEEIKLKEQNINKQNIELESLQKELNEKDEKILILTENRAYLEDKLQSKEDQISQLHYEHSELNSKIATLEDDFKLKINELVEANGKLTKEVEIKEQSMSEQKLEFDYIQKEVIGKDDTIKLLMENVGKLEDELKSILNTNEDQISQLNIEITDLNTKIRWSEKNFETEIKKLEDAKNNLVEEIQIREQFIREQKSVLGSTQQELSGKDEKIAILTENLTHLEEELKSKEDQISQLNDEQSELNSRIKMVEENLKMKIEDLEEAKDKLLEEMQMKEKYMVEQKLELESRMKEELCGKDEKIKKLSDNIRLLEDELKEKEILISQLDDDKSELNAKIGMLEEYSQRKIIDFEQAEDKLVENVPIKERKSECIQQETRGQCKNVSITDNVRSAHDKLDWDISQKEAMQHQIEKLEKQNMNCKMNFQVLEDKMELKMNESQEVIINDEQKLKDGNETKELAKESSDINLQINFPDSEHVQSELQIENCQGKEDDNVLLHGNNSRIIAMCTVIELQEELKQQIVQKDTLLQQFQLLKKEKFELANQLARALEDKRMFELQVQEHHDISKKPTENKTAFQQDIRNLETELNGKQSLHFEVGNERSDVNMQDMDLTCMDMQVNTLNPNINDSGDKQEKMHRYLKNSFENTIEEEQKQGDKCTSFTENISVIEELKQCMKQKDDLQYQLQLLDDLKLKQGEQLQKALEENQLLFAKVEEYNQTLKNIEEDRAILQQHVANLESELNEKKVDILNIENDLRAELMEKNKSLSNTKEQKNELEKHYQILQEDLQMSVKQLELLKIEMNEKSDDKNKILEDLTMTRDELIKVQCQLTNLEDKTHTLEKELYQEALAKDDLQKRYDQLEELKAEYEKTLQKEIEEKNILEMRLREQVKITEDTVKSKSALQEDMNYIQKELNTKKSLLLELEKKRNDSDHNHALLEEEIKVFRSAKVDLEEQLHRTLKCKEEQEMELVHIQRKLIDQEKMFNDLLEEAKLLEEQLRKEIASKEEIQKQMTLLQNLKSQCEKKLLEGTEEKENLNSKVNELTSKYVKQQKILKELECANALLEKQVVKQEAYHILEETLKNLKLSHEDELRRKEIMMKCFEDELIQCKMQMEELNNQKSTLEFNNRMFEQMNNVKFEEIKSDKKGLEEKLQMQFEYNSKLEEEVNVLKEQICVKEREVIEVKTQMLHLENQFKNDIATKQECIQCLQKSNLECEAKLLKEVKERKHLQMKIDALENRTAKHDATVMELDKATVGTKDTLDKLLKENKSLQNELQLHKMAINEEKKIIIQQLECEKKISQELLKKIKDLSTEKDNLLLEIERSNSFLCDYIKTIKDLEKQNSVLELQLKHSEQSSNESSKLCVQNIYMKLQEEIQIKADMENKLQTLQKELADAKKQINDDVQCVSIAECDKNLMNALEHLYDQLTAKENEIDTYNIHLNNLFLYFPQVVHHHHGYIQALQSIIAYLNTNSKQANGSQISLAEKHELEKKIAEFEKTIAFLQDTLKREGYFYEAPYWIRKGDWAISNRKMRQLEKQVQELLEENRILKENNKHGSPIVDCVDDTVLLKCLDHTQAIPHHPVCDSCKILKEQIASLNEEISLKNLKIITLNGKLEDKDSDSKLIVENLRTMNTAMETEVKRLQNELQTHNKEFKRKDALKRHQETQTLELLTSWERLRSQGAGSKIVEDHVNELLQSKVEHLTKDKEKLKALVLSLRKQLQESGIKVSPEPQPVRHSSPRRRAALERLVRDAAVTEAERRQPWPCSWQRSNKENPHPSGQKRDEVYSKLKR